VDKAPRPHTEEWFKEMRSRNPGQAAMTEHIIKLAGTYQCCSICGDTANVADYMGVEQVSARLCEDCKGASGEGARSAVPAVRLIHPRG
jgi:hypothetical protein